MNIKQLLKDKDERNLLINIGLAFAVKGVAMLISLFSMPLYIKYFNNDDVLGLWYTILSLLHWVLICDLGLGNGLRNRLTEALAVGDHQKSKDYISSTYAAIAVIMIPIAIIGAIVFQFVNLNAFFNIDETIISASTLRAVLTILWCSICINLIFKTINVIIYAVQKSSLNNIISLVISIIPLIYIAIFKGDNMESNLISLTIVHVIASNLPLLVATVALFCTKELRNSIPSLKNCKFKTAKSMLGFGVQFFGAQIFFMFLTSTNEIIITKVFSSADVVDYSIYYRLFTLVGSLFMLALTPLWSKVTKDLAQKKYKKIQKTNRFLYILSALATVGQFVMVLLCQFLVNIWLQDEAITISYPIALVFAFYGSVYIFNVVLTTVANGIGDLKTQIIFYGISSVLKIPVILLLATQFQSWSVVMFYNAVALLVFCIFQIIWLEKTLKKLSKEAEQQISIEQNETSNP